MKHFTMFLVGVVAVYAALEFLARLTEQAKGQKTQQETDSFRLGDL